MSEIKDWTGGKPSIFTCHGASNHSENVRQEHDYYATDPIVVPMLLEQEQFSSAVWECAVGGGHIAEELKKAGYTVVCSDIVDRGYPGTNILDFLAVDKETALDMDIITNPPYKYALEFAQKAMEILSDGRKLAMFMKLTFLEGKKRQAFFEEYPPKTVYVLRSRVDCAFNGDFSGKPVKAVCYAWFVWEKGYKGDPHVKWIN